MTDRVAEARFRRARAGGGGFRAAVGAADADADAARWRAECAVSDDLIARFDLDDTRPNGHADLIRERIDGATGV